MTNPAALVQKLWNYCNILRDDGLSYGDYVEQLTFLLFLKMADEQSRPPFNKPSPIPKGKDWPALLAKDGDELEIHYRHTLEDLGKRPGMLGVIFRKAQNKIQDPAKQRRGDPVRTIQESHGDATHAWPRETRRKRDSFPQSPRPPRFRVRLLQGAVV